MMSEFEKMRKHKTQLRKQSIGIWLVPWIVRTSIKVGTHLTDGVGNGKLIPRKGGVTIRKFIFGVNETAPKRFIVVFQCQGMELVTGA
jgi:hypothetical protein